MRHVALTNSHEFAVVDEECEAMVSAFMWHAVIGRNCTYARSNDGQKMHHVVMGMKPQRGFVVDHIDQNGLNNLRSNLRVCTHAQNGWNSTRKTGASGHPGVSKSRGNWAVRFEHLGKTMYFGTFRALDEARSVATREMGRLRGEYMPLRARLQELERVA